MNPSLDRSPPQKCLGGHARQMLAVALLLGCPLAIGADPAWTQWRGPARDGFVTGGDWPDGLAPERLEKRWRVELGPSYSGPVLAGDLVIVTETRAEKT